MVAQRGVEMSYLYIPGLNNFVIFRLYIEIVLNKRSSESSTTTKVNGWL